MEIFNNLKESFIHVNDLKLHVMIAGSGKPVLLLHGFPDFWYGWKNIIIRLQDKFNLIVPDLRGYNLSDKPKGIENYKIDLLVEDIKNLAKELKIDSFYLVGHDWGGVIAWCFAEKYPEYVKKMLILNAPHPKIFQEKLRYDEMQRKASFYIFEFLKPKGEMFLLENDFNWLKKVVFNGTVKKDAFTEEDKRMYLKAWKQEGAIEAGVNYYRANLNFDEWTGIINVPTFVMHGMKDVAIMPSILEELSNYVKKLEVEKVNDSSHWIMYDAPQKVVNKIIEFFN
ncbi:MAG: alpha/beta fold hydrolase [Promethearchaeota archaeon]